MPDLNEKKLVTTNELLFYHQAIKTLLADKVAKEEGKSLLSNTEIARLATLVNYDDSTITSDVSDIKTRLSAVEAGTFDDTQLRKDVADTYVTLASMENYAKKTDIPTTLPASDVPVWAKSVSKPEYSASEVGADPSGSAADALADAKAYTNEKIADLIGGAPETLDTLKELGDAMTSNKSVIDSLNEAIGTKANTTHTHKASDIDLSNYVSKSDLATNEDIQTILNA